MKQQKDQFLEILDELKRLAKVTSFGSSHLKTYAKEYSHIFEFDENINPALKRVLKDDDISVEYYALYQILDSFYKGNKVRVTEDDGIKITINTIQIVLYDDYAVLFTNLFFIGEKFVLHDLDTVKLDMRKRFATDFIQKNEKKIGNKIRNISKKNRYFI